MRDEFSDLVTRTLAQRVNHRFSNPGCRAATSGSQIDPEKSINIGVAAHISAAAAGGPRYDIELSTVERKHPDNGVWLCQSCAKMVDNDPARFTATELRQWKRSAEVTALAAIGQALGLAGRDRIALEESDFLVEAAVDGDLWVIRTMEGTWVRAGRTDFHEQDDPSYGANYLDALDELLRKGVARHLGRKHFALTGQGHKVARALNGSGE